jgi:hypothetical protein
MHFPRQFEHEMHFCEICAKTAEQLPEGPSHFCLQGTQTSQRQPQLHLQYHYWWWNMRTVMTLRLSSSHHNGGCQIHHSWKTRVKLAVMSVHVDCFFSTSKELSIRNSYPWSKPSIVSFTVRFWSSWGRVFSANVQTSGRTTIGFSTMTTHPLTHHCSTISDFQKHYSDSPPFA